MIWVEIDGLPLAAWFVNCNKKISSLWGKFVFMAEEKDESLVCRWIENDSEVESSESEDSVDGESEAGSLATVKTDQTTDNV
ncbi:hypothetical protein L1987_80843 [Smallanthus sonchifolius]|uniref:Uncharacterized protein n=1 Tax=Smallanthus sonchifolius TaxID=185202 RepID=A0ACB8YNS7_9ASTR|nr:hypothetical protein L1987_80843 [Smallanthus sonchifolius]